jgi:hypothetical protein
MLKQKRAMARPAPKDFFFCEFFLVLKLH